MSFKAYLSLKERVRLLKEILGKLSAKECSLFDVFPGNTRGWKEIPRKNAAYFLPSDFSLLKVERW